MRLVFISSVTAMTPLRTISVITGSGARRDFFGGGVFALRAMNHVVVGWVERSETHQGSQLTLHRDGLRCAQPIHSVWLQPLPNRNREIAEVIHLKRIAGHQ